MQTNSARDQRRPRPPSPDGRSRSVFVFRVPRSRAACGSSRCKWRCTLALWKRGQTPRGQRRREQDEVLMHRAPRQKTELPPRPGRRERALALATPRESRARPTRRRRPSRHLPRARAALSQNFSSAKKTKRPRATVEPDSSTLHYPPPAGPRPPLLPLLPSPDQGPAVGPGRGVSPPLPLPRAPRTLHVPEDHGVVAILAGLRAVPRRRHHLRRSVRPRRHTRGPPNRRPAYVPCRSS